MPHRVNLKGVRGDAFHAAIPMMQPTGPAPVPGDPPPMRPMTVEEAQAIKDTWPTIRMQARADGIVLFTLTSAAGELEVDTAHPQPDGTTAPMLVITGPPEKMTPAVKATYDVQFTNAAGRPFTWIGGAFVLTQDVTDATA